MATTSWTRIRRYRIPFTLHLTGPGVGAPPTSVDLVWDNKRDFPLLEDMTCYVLHVNRFLKTHSRMNAVLDDAPEVWPTLIAWPHKSKKSMIKWKKLDPEAE